MKGIFSIQKDRLALHLDSFDELLVINTRETWVKITSKVPAPKWNTVREINIRVRDICQAIAVQNPNTLCMVYEIPQSVVDFFRWNALDEQLPLSTVPREGGDITIWGPLYG